VQHRLRRRSPNLETLFKTLKASIALVTCAGQREIQVHLFAKFGYTQADKEQVSEALRVAKSFPSFQSGTDVSVYIHSKLPTPIPTETSAGQTINAAGGSASTRNMHAPAVTGQPNAVTPSLFQSVGLRIDKSIIMKDLDEAAYNTLTSYASSFIRPYATERMTAAEPGEPASFVMGGPKISMLVAFGQAVGGLSHARRDTMLIRHCLGIVDATLGARPVLHHV
jgi:hypothetical protein